MRVCKGNKGSALIETMMLLGLLVSMLYFEMEGIKLSGLKLAELQKKRLPYDGERQ